jgi:hypothetical protein
LLRERLADDEQPGRIEKHVVSQCEIGSRLDELDMRAIVMRV